MDNFDYRKYQKKHIVLVITGHLVSQCISFFLTVVQNSICGIPGQN